MAVSEVETEGGVGALKSIICDHALPVSTVTLGPPTGLKILATGLLRSTFQRDFRRWRSRRTRPKHFSGVSSMIRWG